MRSTNCEDVESLLACYLFDLESYPVCNDKTTLVNTEKPDRKQLPTEKLFGLVMIFGRHKNLTKIHRGFDFRWFPNRSFIFYAKIQRQSVINPNLCVSLMYIFCAKYFSSHLELNCRAKLISYGDTLSDYVRTMPL